MSFDDFGGPSELDSEARRLAFLLNGAGDPHLAAAQLSQDLQDLPIRDAAQLIGLTKLYQDPGAIVRLIEIRLAAVYLDTGDLILDERGQPIDSGCREIRVIGPDIDDRVAILQTRPGCSVVQEPDCVSQLYVLPVLGMTLSWWQSHCDEDRAYWSDRISWWSNYDGARQGFRPDPDQVAEFQRHKNVINNIYRQHNVVVNSDRFQDHDYDYRNYDVRRQLDQQVDRTQKLRSFGARLERQSGK